MNLLARELTFLMVWLPIPLMLTGEAISAAFLIILVATTNILIINLYPFTQLLYILKSNYY